MDLETIGRLMLFIGAGVAVFGGFLLVASRVPFLNQLFNLPGDIRVQTEGFSCFVPIVSMIIISIVLTIIVNVVIRILNK